MRFNNKEQLYLEPSKISGTSEFLDKCIFYNFCSSYSAIKQAATFH